MLVARLRAIGEHTQRHLLAAIDERGERGYARFAGHGFRDGQHREIAQPLGRELLSCPRRERTSRVFAERIAQRIEVARVGQHALAVEHAQVHAQVRFQCRFVEIGCRNVRASRAPEEAREFARDRIRARGRPAFRECAREIRRGHEVAAKCLRQPADQAGRLLLVQAGHQPRQSRRIERVQQVDRHQQGHAVVGPTRFEAVRECETRIAQREVLRKSLGFAALARQQIGQRPFESVPLLGRSLLEPRVQPLRGADVRRQAIEIPACLPVLVGDQARAAQLGFLLARLFERREIARDESAACVDLPGDQTLAHEQLARLGRRDAAVVHRALGCEHQAKQTDLLRRSHPALVARPVRIEVAAREQVRQLLDRPIRFDARIGHAPDLRGVEQGRRQHPRRRQLRQRRSGEQLEASLPRTLVDLLLVFLSDLHRQADDQGAMQGSIVGGCLVRHPAKARGAVPGATCPAPDRPARPSAAGRSRSREPVARERDRSPNSALRQAPAAGDAARAIRACAGNRGSASRTSRAISTGSGPRARERTHPRVSRCRGTRTSDRRRSRAPHRPSRAHRRVARADPGSTGRRRSRTSRTGSHGYALQPACARASRRPAGARACVRLLSACADHACRAPRPRRVPTAAASRRRSRAHRARR